MRIYEEIEAVGALSSVMRKLAGLRSAQAEPYYVGVIDEQLAALAEVCGKFCSDIRQQIKDDAAAHVTQQVSDIMHRRSAA
jgi:type II secretory pathway predicted ATPase ExeA